MYAKGKAKIVKVCDSSLQRKVMMAVDSFAAIVGATLGPGGRPILIERQGLPPIITKDGVTVARSIQVTDPIDDIVITAVREASERTANSAGDGTTTSVILARAILHHGFEWLSKNSRVSPQQFSRQIQRDFEDRVLPALRGMAQTVDDKETMLSVAKISSNGDLAVSTAVVEAVLKSGEDGAILLEESAGTEIEVEVKEGFTLPKGYDYLGSVGTIFITDERTQEGIYDNPVVIFFNGTLRDIYSINPILVENAASQNVRPIVVVAHDFSDEVKQIFALNTKKSALKLIPVMTVRDGTNCGREMQLQDLAAYCNGKVLDPVSAKDAKLQDCGDCDQLRFERFQVTFLGEPDQKAIARRIEDLKGQIQHVDKEIDSEIIKERIGRLTGGVVTIKIGGRSDLAVRESKARVEDAVCALRAALKAGIVPGGATTYLRLSQLDGIHDVLQQALREPFAKLLDNSGIVCEEDQRAIAKEVETTSSGVYDVARHVHSDAFEAGVIDPTSVIESAIGNALSVASTLSTLGGIVVEPRDSTLERQLELSDKAFENMQNAGVMNQ
jgi:chaperonin GroEL